MSEEEKRAPYGIREHAAIYVEGYMAGKRQAKADDKFELWVALPDVKTAEQRIDALERRIEKMERKLNHKGDGE